MRIRYKRALTYALFVFLCVGTVNVPYAISQGASADGAAEEISNGSQEVQLSLNFSERTIIYGSVSYLDDIEAFDASGNTIDAKDVEWSSDAENVVSVKYGTLFINGEGSAVISAKYNGNEAFCKINVVKAKVSIKKNVLKDKRTGQVCTDWYTATAGSKLTITSGNKKVAKIQEDGSLKVLSLGKTVIKVKAKYGNTAKYTMYVTKKHVYINDDQSINLKKYIKNIKSKNVKLSVKDITQAKLSADGTLTPLKSGKCTINVSAGSKKYKIEVRMVNYNALKQCALDTLNSTLRYPASLSINSITSTARSITIDYSSINRYGGYNRDKFIMQINMKGEYSYKTVSIFD